MALAMAMAFRRDPENTMRNAITKCHNGPWSLMENAIISMERHNIPRKMPYPVRLWHSMALRGTPERS